MPFFISLLAALAVGILYTKHRSWALGIILFLLPSYVVRFDVLGIPMTMLELLILSVFTACVLTYILSWLRRKKLPALQWNSKQQWTALCICLFVIASIFGLLVSPDLHTGAGIWKAYIIEPILFFLVCIWSIKTPKDVQPLIMGLMLSAACIASIAIVQYATGLGIPAPWQDIANRRSTALYGYPNAVGLYLAPVMTFLFGYVAIYTRQTKKVPTSTSATHLPLPLMIITIFLCGIALLCAHVEGAIIAVAAGMGFILLYTRLRWVTIGLGILIISIALLYPPTREILLFQDVSGDVRLALWKGTLNLLYHQPIFGAGLAGFPMTYDLYRLPSHVELLLYPHNIFLDFWVELGLIGFVWIISVFTATLWNLKRALSNPDLDLGKRMLSISLMGVFVCIIVYGLVDVPYFKNDLSVLFWTWLAFAYYCGNLPEPAGS